MGYENVLRVEGFLKDRIGWCSGSGYSSFGRMVIAYRDEVPRDDVLTGEELEKACASCPVGKERIPGLICGGMKYVNRMQSQMVAEVDVSDKAQLPEGAEIFCGLDNARLQSMKEAPTIAEVAAQYTGDMPLVPYN
ncbi:hypothetical protein A2875_03005 [Candidatus Gottesmanbacteria bacterium RIFCSPHIGHO2_01_FULL_46_14]|uniref:Uncharacterized protein n=2 Tax=Candidatus Gottesmaniibacteriota TaxID=1752720 RepID=A0A1F5ZRE2_9BACT|nr:MAG: hypothetical protein A2875_03005 [Candidatus Gottesmanbacteria bacterium RIFCSPHIGHO2_01_FULL_46_14]OGG30326.1 MAG: hypothetical protein A2971_01895 [Candidatus Gottesmanbacteria bacterium RIFCSPLOWO2_01_FULL_46_21]